MVFKGRYYSFLRMPIALSNRRASDKIRIAINSKNGSVPIWNIYEFYAISTFGPPQRYKMRVKFVV